MRTLKLFIGITFVISYGAFTLLKSTRVAGQTGEGSLATPTAVNATDNTYNNKVGVYWDTIRGATAYRIFRNTANTATGATDLGTTQAAFFFDATATAGQSFFYFVRAENGTTQSAMSTSDQGKRSTTSGGGTQPLEPPSPAPAGNPLTAAKAYLGKTLFWDEQLSSTRTVSCGTCHILEAGGADLRTAVATSTNPGPDSLFGTADDIRGSAGIPSTIADGTYLNHANYKLGDQVTGRKSVSAINAVYEPILFWDGRASNIFRDPLTNNIILSDGGALESQAAGPPTSDVEMAHNGRNWNDVAARVSSAKPLALVPSMPTALSAWIGGRTYPEIFQEVYGTPDVTPVRILLAIGTYERTLFSDQSPVDIANSGGTALTAQEQRGRNIFNGPSSCSACHGGGFFTDNSFHNIGVRPQSDDTGRFQVTGQNGDLGQFRTPSLRNVGLRSSYFHNGRFTTLEEVVAFYNRGGDFGAPNKDPQIRPLGLSSTSQADLVAFLRRPLTDPRVTEGTAPFDRPTLYMESNRVPQLTGTGRTGSGGFTPQIKAISPPLAGNPNFTVSVNSALGNAPGVLVIDSVDPGTGSTIPATGSFVRVTANTQNTGAGNGWASVSIPIPDISLVVGQTYYARWYITDAGAANGFSVSQAAKFTVFGEASAPTRAKFVDFDGDGRTDISVFRPDDNSWYVLRSSSNSLSVQQFGSSTDTLAPADYDGDGKTDIAVYRDGVWYLNESRDGIVVLQFGLPGDIVQGGDFDGDGKDDLAVFRPSNGTWYMQKSRDGFGADQFGIATDKPVAADFDGDGKADIAVYRDGTWYIRKSTGGDKVASFGLATDDPVVGDYDGDGKADIAVWRPTTGTWYRVLSSDGSVSISTYGIGTDVPAPGDYDGDGKSDLTVFRPSGGMWFGQNTSGSERIVQFGLRGDRPIPSVIVP
ncbi:hypothetical protein BH10ACI3_BH10ACI3_00490 [soil metagenome]